MIINKNIWNIILDKVALNRWKNQVKNINLQYHTIFFWMGEICFWIIGMRSSGNFINVCYNCHMNNTNKYDRMRCYLTGDLHVKHLTIKKCIICNHNNCVMFKYYEFGFDLK